MRTYIPDGEPVRRSAARGRAVLYAVGTDAPDGHLRYTRAGAAGLYGGSESAHSVMQERALRIQKELEENGISLDSMSYEQYRVAKAIVEKANRE